MRIHAIIILLVIFTFLSSIKSQEKNCTKWTPLKNQNSTEFLGDWYGYQRLTNGFKRRERCSLYQYSWNSMLNAVDMIITNIEENGNIFKREGKIFTIEPNIAQWQVELKNGYTFISSAIALNGSSYAIFAACRRNEVYVWIITRNRYPSKEVKKLINDELDKHNLVKSNFINLCK